MPPDLQERILRKIERRQACWLWTAARRDNGYGVIGWRYEGRNVTMQAHRAAFAAWRGPIPAGLHLHHTCERRLCVNPWHVEPITRRDHLALHRRTHCKRGHLLNETRVSNGPSYTCGVCRRARDAARRRAA